MFENQLPISQIEVPSILFGAKINNSKESSKFGSVRRKNRDIFMNILKISYFLERAKIKFSYLPYGNIFRVYVSSKDKEIAILLAKKALS